MLKSDLAVLQELEVGPATVRQIIDETRLSESAAHASVARLYRAFHIAKSSISEDQGDYYRDVAIYMLPEHAKAWGGRIATCREDAHSG